MGNKDRFIRKVEKVERLLKTKDEIVVL